MKKLTLLGAALAIAMAVAGPVRAEDTAAALMATANAENGAKVFKQCATCHTVDKGGANKIGPNLFGIFGAKKGHIAGFAYSKGLTEKGGTWDVESLDAYLLAPSKYIPGSKMAFVGLKKAQDRADVIKYLQSLK
jgi:cytochrome c